jgi:hypothetical protein
VSCAKAERLAEPDGRRCVFYLPLALLKHELVLLVFVGRRFQGDPDPAWDAYSNPVRPAAAASAACRACVC